MSETTLPSDRHLASGFFVLRTPLLPFCEFVNLSKDTKLPGALESQSELDSAVDSDRKLISSKLREIVKRPEVAEALWVASPEFVDEISSQLDNPEYSKHQKLEYSFCRYFARMCSRSTPFGLFGGCSLGKIDKQTSIELGPRQYYQRRSRLDMGFVYDIVQKIISDPKIRNTIRFHPNSSLHFFAGRYRHIQSYVDNSLYMHRSVATEPSVHLQNTLERAGSGATPEELIAAIITANPKISEDSARGYIGGLINSQILVPDLIPPLTGPDAVHDLLEHLNMDATMPWAEVLSRMSQYLESADKLTLGAAIFAYKSTANLAANLPVSFELGKLIQVDMIKPITQSSLDCGLVREILEGVNILNSFQGARTQPELQHFRSNFTERYQDEEVPLLQALDPDTGITLESTDRPVMLAEPLLSNIDLFVPNARPAPASNGRESSLLKLLQESWHKKSKILELDSSLLEAIKMTNPPSLPDAFSVTGVVAPNGNGMSEASFFLQSVFGPSGVNFLTRFCHADPELTRRVKEHVDAEEKSAAAKDAVFAEIAHVPEGRAGNVSCRPVLRSYEIPYLATSRLPKDRQISVSDLFVSVRNGRIVLRSQRLGREVIPRLTSGHLFTHGGNLKLYKFLCLLQSGDRPPEMYWNWGALDRALFLPRIIKGRIVFALARWLIDKETLELFFSTKPNERLRVLHDWRMEWDVPRFAFLSEGDNKLLVDFHNILSLETFLDHVRKKSEAVLIEMFPDVANLCVHGPEGTFVHDMVIPFVKETQSRTEPGVRTNVKQATARPVAISNRGSLPGSEWLYAKFYTPTSESDRLLLQDIGPLAAELLSSRHADQWFFIRYGDPHPHLRFRLHGDADALMTHVLPAVCRVADSAQREGKVWRFQFDTYQREVERYGGEDGLIIAEQLFWVDSELCIELLGILRSQLRSDLRWRISLVAVDHLLNGLGFDLDAKMTIVESMRRHYEKRFSVGDHYRGQISEKFRRERRMISQLIENPSVLPVPIQNALNKYSSQLADIRSRLTKVEADGGLTKSTSELATDYVHMQTNRFAQSAAIYQEMILCDFLGRTYRSMLARGKK